MTKVKIIFMLPDEPRKGMKNYSWHKVTKQEFIKEWAINGLFENVTSCYSMGGLVLYINVEEPKRVK